MLEEGAHSSVPYPHTSFGIAFGSVVVFGAIYEHRWSILAKFLSDTYFLILLVITIALLVILAGFGKLISRDLYPLAIFVIAVSLLYPVSLVSTYLTGFHVQSEYHAVNFVLSNG